MMMTIGHGAAQGQSPGCTIINLAQDAKELSIWAEGGLPGRRVRHQNPIDATSENCRKTRGLVSPADAAWQ